MTKELSLTENEEGQIVLKIEGLEEKELKAWVALLISHNEDTIDAAAAALSILATAGANAIKKLTQEGGITLQ